MPTDKYENRTCLLKTLSPVHIGSGDVVQKDLLSMVEHKPMVYVIDAEKLLKKILETDKETDNLSDVESFLEQREEIVLDCDKQKIKKANERKNFMQGRFKALLGKYNIKTAEDYKAIARSAFPSGTTMNLPATRDGNYFLSGSAIKGALKTAVLYHMIKHQETTSDFSDWVFERIEEFEQNKVSRERLAKELMEKYFQSIMPQELPRNTRRASEEEGSFKDFFRAVKVKDAVIELPAKDLDHFGTITDLQPENNRLIVTTLSGARLYLPADISVEGHSLYVGLFVKILATEKVGSEIIIKKLCRSEKSFCDNQIDTQDVQLVSLDQNNQAYKKPFLFKNYETFHGSSIVDIAIDHSILDSFKNAEFTPPFEDIPSLLEICREFASEIWKEERNYLTKDMQPGGIDLNSVLNFYNCFDGQACLRLGWGSGMLSTTVALFLTKVVRRELRNKVVTNRPRNWLLPAPKSRRFAIDKETGNYVPLGWIEFEEV